MSLTIEISKHPTTNNKREVSLRIWVEENDIHGIELKAVCLIWQLDNQDNRLTEIRPDIRTLSTVGGYVDTSGKKKDKNDSGAIEKKDYYTTKIQNSTKTTLAEILVDIFEEEVLELDKDNYFD